MSVPARDQNAQTSCLCEWLDSRVVDSGTHLQTDADELLQSGCLADPGNRDARARGIQYKRKFQFPQRFIDHFVQCAVNFDMSVSSV